MLRRVQKQWFGHGVLMMCVALLGGVGLWMFMLGGFEIVPGYIVHFQLPGTLDGWRHMHTGPMLNALMVIGVALVIPVLDFKEKTAKILGWLIVAEGWGNCIFYFFGNLAQNHALSFGPNRLGPESLSGIIGLAPAYLFGAIAIIVTAMIGWRGVRALRSDERPSET